jgi:ABC-type antimicrobial peptide transport system permease subunit
LLLLNTRERIQDTATLKALDMSPRQVMVMVQLGGQRHAACRLQRVQPAELLLILVLGVGVAVAAALLPGRWAARANVVEVLHSE